MKIRSVLLSILALSSLGLAPAAIAGRPGARPVSPRSATRIPCTVSNTQNPGGAVVAYSAPDVSSEVKVRLRDGAGVQLRDVSQDGRWLLIEPVGSAPAGETTPQGWVQGSAVGCTG